MRSPNSSYFRYWVDGSTPKTSAPLPCAPEERALPFVVTVRSRAYIPVHVTVFARTTAHAAERVRKALRECAENSFQRSGRHMDNEPEPHRAIRVLQDLAEGGMTLTVEPYDTNIMSSVGWADNDCL